MNISAIIERHDVAQYLQKRRLLKQYKKAKNFLLSGFYDMADFKKRKPKIDDIYYFRINRQFRAFCYFEEDILVVFEINNHQN